MTTNILSPSIVGNKGSNIKHPNHPKKIDLANLARSLALWASLGIFIAMPLTVYGSPPLANEVVAKKSLTKKAPAEDPLIDLIDSSQIRVVRVITNELTLYIVPPSEEDVVRDGCIYISVEPKDILDLSNLIKSSGLTAVEREWGGSPRYGVYFYLATGSTIRLLLDRARGRGKTVKGWLDSKQVMANDHLIEDLKKFDLLALLLDGKIRFNKFSSFNKNDIDLCS